MKKVENNVGAGPVSARLKRKQKNSQKGITLIALIITVIIMLILAGVTINVGTGNLDNSRMVNFVTYMQTIQTKVDLISETGNFGTYGREMTKSEQATLQGILNREEITSDVTDFKFFDSNSISSQLEINNIKDEVAVNFATREVVSLNGVEYEDQMHYTQYNLPGGQALIKTGEITRKISFKDIISNINGLNSTFTIKNMGITNGTLSYGKEYVGENDEITIKWTIVTNYTKKGDEYTTPNITESGVYYFKLVDNVTGTDNAKEEGVYPSLELRLTNSPKLEGNLTDLSLSYNYSDLTKSENWVYATDSETNNIYVWIPRFAYETENTSNLEFLRGTSDVTTSGGYINDTDWTEPDVFTEGTSKKTGVWLQVDSLNKERHRYN